MSERVAWGSSIQPCENHVSHEEKSERSFDASPAKLGGRLGFVFVCFRRKVVQSSGAMLERRWPELSRGNTGGRVGCTCLACMSGIECI